MNECVNYCLADCYRINRARIVTEAALGLNGWIGNGITICGRVQLAKNIGELHRK